MKFFVCVGMMIVLLGIWVEVGTAQTTITATDMPDANLRAAVLAELKTAMVVANDATTFTREDMADEDFTVVNASSVNVGDLTGLRYATNLTTLRVNNGSLSATATVSDISEVRHLTNLTDLSLSGNSISDISAVANLTALEELYLSENRISSISAVANLTALIDLYLDSNRISSISAVANLTALTDLRLSENRISSISAVENLNALTRLHLSSNSISNISAVANLTALTDLRLSNNRISDISAVANLTALTDLRLSENRIRNTDALLGLTNLTFLSLRKNRITDIAEFQKLKPLADGTLTTLRLSPINFNNNISAVRNNVVATLQSFLWTQPDDIPADDAVRSRRYSGNPPTTTFRFPITFSEAVFGFEMEDITVETELETGTGTATLEALSPTGRLAQSYTVTIRLPANAAGTVTITVRALAAETDAGARTPAEDLVYDPIPFSTIPPPDPVTEAPKRRIIFQCPVGWQKTDRFAGRTRRVLIYEIKLEMDTSNRISIYKPISVAIYVHPDEALENLEGWKLQVAIPYNHHREYLLTAENSVVVESTIEGVEGGFAVIENPEEMPFPMTGIGFTGALVPGFDYRLYDDTGRKVDFGISCYKRVDIFQVLKDMEDPRVLRKVLLGTLDWDSPYIRTEWTVPVPVNVPGSPSLPRVNLVGKWADLKKQ